MGGCSKALKWKGFIRNLNSKSKAKKAERSFCEPSLPFSLRLVQIFTLIPTPSWVTLVDAQEALGERPGHVHKRECMRILFMMSLCYFRFTCRIGYWKAPEPFGSPALGNQVGFIVQ